MRAEYPILEFDTARNSIIEPSRVLKPLDGMPERCVLPIYHTVIAGLQEKGLLSHVTDIGTSMGPMPVYRMEHAGNQVAVAHPGLGAPFAAAVLEELIAFGCRKFIACGSAGVLDGTVATGMVVVPSGAVRDEGTSYHYAAPAREIAAQSGVVQVIQAVLQRHAVPFRIGKTWTTDAFYRETPRRVADRKSEGCVTVEMECAALVAVAAFRGVRFGQLLAARDDVSGSEWDPGDAAGHATFAEKLFWWSVEACLEL